MRTYILTPDLGGVRLSVRSGERSPVDLVLVGAGKSASDKLAYRGSEFNRMALTVLVNALALDEDIVLSGRHRAFKLHVLFASVLANALLVREGKPLYTPSDEVLAWYKTQGLRAEQRSLFEGVR